MAIKGRLNGGDPSLVPRIMKLFHPAVRLLVAALPFLVLCAVPCPSLASGLLQGARTSGMGAAFVAVSDDASSVASNPAGMTQLKGTQLYGGGALIALSSRFDDLTGHRESTDAKIDAAPHLYLTTDLRTADWRFGIGIFSPFGIGGRIWNNEGATRYLSTRNRIATLTVNPAVAYRISDHLSVGVGIDAMYSENDQRWMVSQSFAGGADAGFIQKSHGVGWGGNAGLLITVSDALRIGATYRSRLRVTHDGDARINGITRLLSPLFGGNSFSTPVSTTVTFPDVYTLGAAYRASSRVLLSCEFERVRWTAMKTISSDLEREVPLAGVRDRTTVTGNKDVWVAKVGAEYYASPLLALRAGYAYWGAPVPTDRLEPGNPDADQHTLSAGFGYRLGKTVVDAFYTLGLYPDRTTGNPALPGRYGNASHYAGISVGYSF